MAFKLARVVVSPDSDSIGVGYKVTPVWSGVDRPRTFSWFVGNLKLAVRLRQAVLAGVVLVDLEMKTDVEGNTYVEHRSKVMAKYANADLRKLGY